MDLKELQAQVALGTVPERLRWTGKKYNRARGTRTCSMCKDKIKKGSKFFDKSSTMSTFNVCMDCSYISFVKILKMKK